MLTMLKVRMSIIVDAKKQRDCTKNAHLRYLFGTFVVCLLFAPLVSALRFSSTIIECVILSVQN